MAEQVLDAEVRARVPDSWKQALLTEAKAFAQLGEKPTEAPVLRTALSEFFAKRNIKIAKRRNGKAAA